MPWTAEGRERIFHIDDKTILEENIVNIAQKVRSGNLSTNYPVCAVCAGPKCLLVGRESGIVNRCAPAPRTRQTNCNPITITAS